MSDTTQSQVPDSTIEQTSLHDRLLEANILITMLGSTCIWLYVVARGVWAAAEWLLG